MVQLKMYVIDKAIPQSKPKQRRQKK